MIGSIWLWVTLALACFWVVGVYNRLMRMRARGAAALRSVDKHMRQCVSLVSQHATLVMEQTVAAASDHPGDASTQWMRLRELLQALDQALQVAKGETLASPSITRVGLAFEAVQASVLHWGNDQSDVVLPMVTDGMRLQWDAAISRAQAARVGLNQIVAKYNEAIAQFPARLLVGLLGVKPAVLM